MREERHPKETKPEIINMCHNLSSKELWQRCQSIGNVREFDTKRRRQKSREFVVLWHDISNGSIHSLGTPAHEAHVSWIQLNRICMESTCIYDCGCVWYIMIQHKMMMLRLHDTCKDAGHPTIRPCLISTARRRLNVASSLSALSPKGSQKPMGSWTPSCFAGSNPVLAGESPKKFLRQVKLLKDFEDLKDLRWSKMI